MDFFEHQEAARKKTKLLVFYFILAVLLILTALNLIAFFVLSGVNASQGQTQMTLANWVEQPGFFYTSGATLGLIGLGSLFRWFQLRGGGKSLASMVGAREILPDTSDRLERRLINVVEEMSIASGMPVPTLYVMDEEEAINAFVAGQESSDTIMVVTRGALEQLTRQELQGVVAHEFSHIFNADMKVNVRLISILAGILILGQAGYFIMRSIRYGGLRSNNREGGGLVAAIVIVGISMYIIGSIGLFFGRLIKAAISRQREFLADASAVQYARDNQGLAGAFLKIGAQSSLLHNRYAEETSHMCIAEPIKLSFSGLATHPPLEQRLNAIMPDWQDFQRRQERKAERIQQREIEAEEKRQEKQKRKGFEAFGTQGAILAGMGGLLETVGNPTTLHLHAANALLLAMPEVLRTAAHNHHASSHAMYLVFALLLSDDGQVENEALDLIEANYGGQSREEVIKLATYITRDKRYLRLAIIDIAIPSIRRLSKTERKNFLALLKQIIRLDSHVSQFEYVLYSLIRKSLQASGIKKAKNIKRFNKVESQIQLILSAMIHASGNNAETKRNLFNNLMVGFSENSMELSPNQFDAESFHQALLRLNDLTPMLKKPLLNAFEEAIKEDGIINVEEVELFRAIAVCLDCPLPPMVEKYSQDLAEKIHHP